MGFFKEIPNIAYQSPLSHKNSSRDYIVIKNIFRSAKLMDYVKGGAIAQNKLVLKDGDRPDTIAEYLYGDSSLDYIVILVAGITNINHEWPLQDYQVYDYALDKYGSETEMNAIRYYETFEIKEVNAENSLNLTVLSNEIEAGSRSKEEAILSKVAFSQKKMEIENAVSLALSLSLIHI